MREVTAHILLLLGAIFMLLAALGVYRMPDLFSRMQTSTKAATLGSGAILFGVAIRFGDVATTARAMLLILFIFLTAPVAAHVIARAAYATGVKLWPKTLVDELQQARQGAIPGHENRESNE